MKKKVMALIMSCLLICTYITNVSAQENSDNPSLKTYTLSLEDAIKMALEKDQVYKNQDSSIKDAQKQLEKARREQKEIEDAIPLPSGLNLLASKKGYYVEQAKISIEVAKLTKTQYEEKTRYLITESYYGVKSAEESMKTAETAYQLALNNNSNTTLQYSLGLVSELDLKNSQYSLNEAKAQRDKFERNLMLIYKSFASKLFIEEKDVKFELTDEIEYEKYTTDLKADTEKAIEKRLDLYQLKSAALQADRYTGVTIALGSNSATHSAAKQSKLTADANYENAVRQVDIQINSLYNTILDTYDSLKLAEENYEIKKQEYDVAVLQYDLGMITNSQLVAVTNAMTSSKIQIDNAKLTYILAIVKYKCETGVGLGM